MFKNRIINAKNIKSIKLSEKDIKAEILRRIEGDEIATKISFARDLLTQNPECEELNELLNRAEKEMQNGNFEESRKLIDGVMNGCKYLVESVKKANNERPSKILQFFFNINRKYINYGLVALLAIILVIGLYYVFRRAPKKPPENQNTQNVQNVQNNQNVYSNTNNKILQYIWFK